MVIAADTVVVSSVPHDPSGLPPEPAKLLEKPSSPSAHLTMLLELVAPVPSTVQSDVESRREGGEGEDGTRRRVEVVTGVAVVWPVIESPGYKIATMAEVTRLWFGDVPLRTLEA